MFWFRKVRSLRRVGFLQFNDDDDDEEVVDESDLSSGYFVICDDDDDAIVQCREVCSKYVGRKD